MSLTVPFTVLQLQSHLDMTQAQMETFDSAVMETPNVTGWSYTEDTGLLIVFFTEKNADSDTLLLTNVQTIYLTAQLGTQQ